MRVSIPLTVLVPIFASIASARFIIYVDEWHSTRPTNPADKAAIDHVVLAFAMANNTAVYQPKVPVANIRAEFPGAKIMIAIGGWGDTVGFTEASKTDAGMQKFAIDVKTMLTNTGADGVDIDWEYPGGNGADYKQTPNDAKAHEIPGYPKLLSAVRSAIGPKKLLSIAVPGKAGDMIAFTRETGPKIWPSVDYINIMSYDLMNRRDNVTGHHTSVTGATDTLKNYLAIGAPPHKINLGFGYYAKYFTTQGDCGAAPLGCPIVPAEDPLTGVDALTSGAWTFEKAHMMPVDADNLTVSYDGICGPEKMTRCASGCCSQHGNCGITKEHCSGACQHVFGTGCTDPDVATSWQHALKHGVTDINAGGQYYFDPENRLFWTWDTPALISRKFRDIVGKYRLGGVMAWSLGEDSYDWSHVRQTAEELGHMSGYGGAGALVMTAGQDTVLNDGEDVQTESSSAPTEDTQDQPQPSAPADEQADLTSIQTEETQDEAPPSSSADTHTDLSYNVVFIARNSTASKHQTATRKTDEGDKDDWILHCYLDDAEYEDVNANVDASEAPGTDDSSRAARWNK